MPDDKFPTVLHKFIPASFSVNEILPFLSNGMIRFTPPGAQNDPFECRGFIDETNYMSLIHRDIQKETKELDLERLSHAEHTKRLAGLAKKAENLRREFTDRDCPGRKKLWQDIFESRDEKLGMLCLSSNIKSSAMWSLYADRHRGVAIGFDAEELAKLHTKCAAYTKLRSVKYGKELASFDMTRERPLGGFDPFFYKCEDWAFEQEWRIAVIFDKLHSKKKVLKNKDPLGQVITLVKLGTHLIREIRIGCEGSKMVEERVRQFAKQSKRPIKIYRMQLATRSYLIEEKLLR